VEVAIVVILTVIVIAVKGLTSLWLDQLATRIREKESEEVEVLQRLQAVEAEKLQLEREKQALDREAKLLENERDLEALNIRKLGAEPLSEREIDEAAAAKASERNEATEEKPKEAAVDGSVEAPGQAAVLVVDDNEELRGLLQQILSKSYRVSTAEDGYAALTKIVQDKERFDVVVTDLKMPNVNGIALMQSLPEGLPVIVISGFLQREEFRRALKELSPFAVFEKPFKTAALKEAIQRAAPTAVRQDESDPQPADAPAEGAKAASGSESETSVEAPTLDGSS
jgi:CheY-like chemotaxis protein